MRIRIRTIEIYTSGGNFLVQRVNESVTCHGQMPDGTRKIEGYEHLPHAAIVPVVMAFERLSTLPNFVPEIDPTKNFRVGSLNRCTDCSGLASAPVQSRQF